MTSICARALASGVSSHETSDNGSFVSPYQTLPHTKGQDTHATRHRTISTCSCPIRQVRTYHIWQVRTCHIRQLHAYDIRISRPLCDPCTWQRRPPLRCALVVRSVSPTFSRGPQPGSMHPTRLSTAAAAEAASEGLVVPVRERIIDELLLNLDVRRWSVKVSGGKHELVIHNAVALRVMEGSRAHDP